MMEKTKNTRKKSKAGNKLLDSYIEYVLEHGRAPASVFKFCKDLGISEEEFYESYGSFTGIEKSLWNGYFQETIKALESDPNFVQFSSREKILSFYFAFSEILKKNRSFVLCGLGDWKIPTSLPKPLMELKKEFENWVRPILEEGKVSNELAPRPYLDQQYPHLFWAHFIFILRFWAKDDSPGFEATDSAIEKSVNLAFELLGNGALDQALDFAKFMFQQPMN